MAEAHVSLAAVKIHYDWDWAGAQRALERAINLNPGYVFAHQWYAYYLELTGYFDEAQTELNSALELDPLSPHLNTLLGGNFYLMHQFERAIKQFQHTIDLYPDYHPAHTLLGRVYRQSGAFTKAIAEFKRSLRLYFTPDTLRFLGHAYAVSGEDKKARRVLDELKVLSKKRHVSPYSMAIVHTGLGEPDQAFNCLERAYHERDDGLVWLKVNLELDSLRSDPRFTSLLQRISLI